MNQSFLTVKQAQEAILEAITPVSGVQMAPIRQALNQVLAKDILSPINVPAHDNSAMDGYALNSEDLAHNGLTTLKVCGIVKAGAPFKGHVERGYCVRIMTGAVLPENTNTVVIQENVSATEDAITFEPNAVKPGENCRKKGEDLTEGKPALKAGKVITPADLGLLASLGVPEVPVHRKVRVAFFSTGDELRSLGEPLDPGCIYDSNRYTLFGMLSRLNFVELIDMGVVKDNPESLEEAMLEAANEADAIITSGGVSVGEADYTKTIMDKLGEVNFWKIAMRPGRPMAYGKIHRTTGHGHATLFGLPGNPVAVMVTFYAFVRNALHKMANASIEELPTVKAVLKSAVRKKPGRTEYQRVKLSFEQNGWHAELTGAQGSGVLRSVSESDGFLVLPHESDSLNAGSLVDIQPFKGLI